MENRKQRIEAMLNGLTEREKLMVLGVMLMLAQEKGGAQNG